MLKTLIKKKSIQQVTIAFIDDTSFYSNRSGVEKKTQNIINQYTTLCKAIGGMIEKEKIHCYSWQWSTQGEQHTIKDLLINIKLHNYQLKQINNDKTTHALGVYVNPKLNWNNQFKIMKKKMIESTTKLMNTRVNTFQTYLFFNMHMTRSVFF